MISDVYEKKQPFYLYTGRGPSSGAISNAYGALNSFYFHKVEINLLFLSMLICLFFHFLAQAL